MKPRRTKRPNLLRALAHALKLLARRVPGAMPLARAVLDRVDPARRSARQLQRAGDPLLLQPFPTTLPDRYPALFDALAERLAHHEAPRILSFGCATGEEVRALRQRLPHARLTGIDLNPWAIARARAADPHPLSEYRIGGTPQAADRFDAVLALAVLRHGVLERDRPPSAAAVLPFAHFADSVARLDAALVPGGWLAIAHAHFRFGDSPAAAGYTPDPAVQAAQPATLLYGPDDCRIDPAGYRTMLWQKRV